MDVRKEVAKERFFVEVDKSNDPIEPINHRRVIYKNVVGGILGGKAEINIRALPPRTVVNFSCLIGTRVPILNTNTGGLEFMTGDVTNLDGYELDTSDEAWVANITEKNQWPKGVIVNVRYANGQDRIQKASDVDWTGAKASSFKELEYEYCWKHHERK